MQDGVHTPRLPFDAVDQDVGGVACPAAANRVHQDPVLALHAIEVLAMPPSSAGMASIRSM